MFFSIIIPVYNVERYLTECVDSILSQSFHSFELILVDDGSSDKSPAICDDYASGDDRVKVIHKPNGGQSSARNTGTEIAQGDYIIYIDSDDFIMDRNFLKKVRGVAEEKDIVFYKHKKFNDATKKFSDCSYSFAGIDENAPYMDSLKKMIMEDAFFGMPWNKCIRRKVIVDNHIRFEEGLTGEDMDWIYYVILNSKSLATIDETFIAYRQRENSITSSVKLKNLNDYVMIIEKWYKNSNDGSYSDLEKDVIFASLAKYYSNLLIMYTRVKDNKKHDYDRRIKDLSALLKYGLSKRPQLIAKMYRVVGFRMTVNSLSALDKIKG